ncbi:MAG: DUF4926 domain-containing protein [Anaerolineaceae bacterium]|nr:MAG: DUF4926 domain-containing protein [Anaerolineaceae bacterium]
MIKEHEQVVLTADLPEHDLKAGDVGVVVHIYGDGEAYELEIFALDGGRTLDVVTVEAAQVRPISRRDVLHVRERSTS